MDILKTFLLNNSAYEVHIINDNAKLYFKAADIGRVLGITNIHNSIIHFDDTEKGLRETETPGGVQNIVFLTREGVYRLVMRSNKAIARPLQTWITHVISTIEETGRYELQKEVDALKQSLTMHTETIKQDFQSQIVLLQQSYEQSYTLSHHETLIQMFADKNIIYIAKIISKDNSIIVKIGSTKQIRVRVTDSRQKYGSSNFTLLHCVETERMLDFERFLQNHADIRKYRYRDDIIGTQRSTEAFLVPETKLKTIISIADRNKNRFRESQETVLIRTVNQLQEAVKALQQDTKNSSADTYSNSMEFSDRHNDGIDHIKDTSDNDECNEGIVNKAPTTATPAASSRGLKRGNHSVMRGRVIQKYSEDGKTLLHTYPRMGICLQDKELLAKGDVSKFGIDQASKRRILYHGYRWFMAPRNTKPDSRFDIGETVYRKMEAQNCAVFKLSLDRTSIIAAFASRSAVAQVLGYTQAAQVIRSINCRKLLQGHMYINHSDASNDMIEAFVERGGVIPEHLSHPAGQAIEQIHPVTGEVIHVHKTIDSVMRNFNIGRKCLKNAISGGLVERGSKWRLATST